LSRRWKRSKALVLKGQQRKNLREAIIGAYPNPDDLQILLSEQMDVQLGAIARGDAYNARVFSLIQGFEADGRIEEFIRVIVADKPKSPHLFLAKSEFKEIFKVEISSNIKSSFNLTEMELIVLELIHESKNGDATNKEIAYDNELDLDEVNCALDDLKTKDLIDFIQSGNFSMDVEKRATINSRGKVFLKGNRSEMLAIHSEANENLPPSEKAIANPQPQKVILEIPEGQVALKSPFYVERPPIESDCYQTILEPGALIRVKAPRQMGKSSLMSRILDQADQAGYHTAHLNFQLVDDGCLSNLEQFLQWFCASIADELGVATDPMEQWSKILGSKKSCTNYFQKHILSKSQQAIALGLDEVDQVFRYPDIATGFFGLLRAWHEKGKNDAIWKRLRLIIVHSKEVYIPLDINQSPFNVGMPVDLPELNSSQVEWLARQHGLEESDEQLDKLRSMFGGHPYLIRVALYELARGRVSLAELLQVAPTEEGLYQEHLRRHLLNLREDSELVDAFKQVVRASQAIQIDDTAAFKLRSMGLVRFKENKVTPLCQLYRQYFRERLGG
jgi:hypothetical protein